MKKFVTCAVLATFSVIGFVPMAFADRWTPVASSGSNGKTYQIDLDSRQVSVNDAGWRHVFFRISSTDDKYAHSAVAACQPYQLKVPSYEWAWDAGYTDEPSYTVGGAIARAACNF